MRETSENLLKPSKNSSLGTKNQNPRENFAQNCPFFEPISGVATPQPSGSNPDRSPTAQWLNMRISPASSLPAPGSDPSLCLQGSTPNPCPARRWRKASCGGGGFQKSQYWPKIPSIQNPWPGRRWRQAPCGAGGFQKSQYWPKFPSIPNPWARRWRKAPHGGGGFQKSQYWLKFPSIQNPWARRRRQAP